MDIFLTPPDAPARPDAPLDRSQPRVTVEEAVELYQLADVARPKRRIQKYCARGDLDCLKVENAFGEQYMITRSSIDVHISHLRQAQGRRARPRRGTPSRAPGRIGNRAHFRAKQSRALSDRPRARPRPRHARTRGMKARLTIFRAATSRIWRKRMSSFENRIQCCLNA